MSRTEIVPAGCFSPRRHSLKQVLGNAAWTRLPEAVRLRFADAQHAVDYVGEFDVVRANALGRFIAWTCRAIGTPVAARTGHDVPAIVHVGPSGRGMEWCREYRWPSHPACLVRSTKVIGADGTLVEELPARLCMSLDVYEEAGILHFVSRSYYFQISILGDRRPWRLVLPRWLSPGTTHVEHIDQDQGWFRFTMSVVHPFFGEVFYQTGRFHASGG